MSDSDTDSDDNNEIDEHKEAKTWDMVEDLIDDVELEDADIIANGRTANQGTSPVINIDDLKEVKFRDPLGILRVAPKSSKKLPDVEDEGFDPVKVLTMLHEQTKYEELVGGARRLARKLSSQEEDIKQLVRDNFDRFISCKDVIDNLYSLINENEISTQGTGTVKLEYTYNDVVARAKRVYGPLLARHDEMEKIRQTLSILSRFAFIFALPSKIAYNVRSGEYEKAVQNYKKACTLAEDSKVGLFQKVMGEVEAIISEFRASLYISLGDANASFEAQVKIIKLLVELSKKSADKDQEDPGWFYLQNTASRLTTLLNDSKTVKVMCTIVTRQIPNLWKMGMHYLGGKFDTNSKQRAQAQAHPETNSKRSRDSLTITNKDAGGKSVAIPIRVYYIDETFASLRVDPAKTCADIIDLCMRRLPLEETELYSDTDFAIYTWIEKRKKDCTNIKVTELPSDEKVYKIHKKWGDNKSGNTHKFLFKRKALKFPKIVDNRDKVIIKNLVDDKVEKEGVTEKRATGKMRSESDFHALVNSILQVFAAKVEHSISTDIIATLERQPSEQELRLDSVPSNNDQDWVFDQMREDAGCVVATQSALQRTGVKDRPLATIADLALNIGRNYVTRVCTQWAAEVSLLYLAAQKEHQDGADSLTAPLFSATQLPNQFSATSRFYMSQLLGIVAGKNHPLLPQVQTAFAEIIRCFADCLHHLAFSSHRNMRQDNSGFGFASQLASQDLQRTSGEQYPLSSASSHSHTGNNVGGGIGVPVSGGEANGGARADEMIISRDGWMIGALSHAEYTRTTIVPQLWKHFLEDFKIGSADQKPEEEISASVDILQLLGGLFLERYIHSKTLTLNYIVKKGIHLSGVDWGLSVAPVAVSEYTMTMLLQFVYIHSEVTSISGNIANVTSKVMSPLVTNALLAIHRAVSQLEGCSIWGILQIRLDLDFFETILSKYTMRDIAAISRNIQDTLDKREDEALEREDEVDIRGLKEDSRIIIDDTIKKSSILFSCLSEKT